MFKRLSGFFLILFVLLLIPCDSYGESRKTLLLVTSEGNWNELSHDVLVSSLLSKSSVGSMNTRINNKDKEIEYYGTINSGTRWNYYETNNMGAVENGLGDYLNQSGLSTAFFSNNNELLKIIEDRFGKTTYKTNEYNKLYSNNNKELLSKSDVILIDMELYNNKKNQEYLIDFIEKNTIRLYIFCPNNKAITLTPFLFYDSRLPYHGYIRSETTKRNGIITNLDLAPSILSYYGIECSHMVSEGIQVYYDKDAYKDAVKELDRIYLLNRYRSSMVKIYLILLITTLALLFIIQKKELYIIKNFFDSLIIFILWIPIILMMNYFSDIRIMYGLFFLVFLLIAGALNIFSFEKILKFTSGAVLSILIVDSLSGSYLQRNSFLGYDPVIGARFYGIGNEYAGIIIGSLYLFIYCIGKSRYFMIISLALQIFIVIILGMSFLGANVGGTISALVGTLLFFIQHYIKNKKTNSYIFLILKIMVLIMIWITMDYFFFKEPSHFGQTLFQVVNGNIKVFIQIVLRKILMNLQLIRYSLWSKFVALVILAISIQFDLDNDVLKKVGVPFIGAMVGAVLFNDSGIVMCGAIAIFFVFPYLKVVRNKIY